MDVKSAFPNEILDEKVYVEQPKGFINRKYPHHVFRLRKALYGLKQAPRVQKTKDSIPIAQIYVDDIVFGPTCDELAAHFANSMQSEFEMSMVGELNFFLGLQVKQLKDVIFISQTKHACELVKHFGFESGKQINTPMSTTLKLSKDPSGIDASLYKSTIGSLLYLTASRPDIAFSVEACAKFQANPKESHLAAVKRIIKYVSSTLEFRLWYPYDSFLYGWILRR